MNLNCIAILVSISLLPYCLNAQELIGSAGESATIGQNLMEWSIGEVIIVEGSTNSNNFTQGIHQPKYVSGGVSTSFVEEESQVKVYPNPFSSDLRIESAENYQGRLINPIGQIVREFEVNASTLLDLKELNASYYFIQLLDEKQEKHHEIKIIKSH